MQLKDRTATEKQKPNKISAARDRTATENRSPTRFQQPETEQLLKNRRTNEISAARDRTAAERKKALKAVYKRLETKDGREEKRREEVALNT